MIFEPSLHDLLIARDLAGPVTLLHPEDDLYGALLAFAATDAPQLPVVDPDDETMVLGLLSRRDVFHAYSRSMPEEKRPRLRPSRACRLPGAGPAADS